MAKIKYVQLEPAAFLADFVGLTPEQRGSYATICFKLYDGSISADPKNLAVLCATTTERFQNEIWPAIKHKFSITNGLLTHKRVTKELKIAKEHHKKRQNAANKRWGKVDAKHIQSNANQNQNQNQKGNSKEKPKRKPQPTTNEARLIYEKWNSYKSQKGWKTHNKLSYEITEAITEQLKHYSIEDLCAAIDNYASILFSPDHCVFNIGKKCWDKFWTLREFLLRGTQTDRKEKYLYRFLPSVFAPEDFLTQAAKGRWRSKKVAEQEKQKMAEQKEQEENFAPAKTVANMPIDELVAQYNDPKTSLWLKRFIKKTRPEIKEILAEREGK